MSYTHTVMRECTAYYTHTQKKNTRGSATHNSDEKEYLPHTSTVMHTHTVTRESTCHTPALSDTHTSTCHTLALFHTQKKTQGAPPHTHDEREYLPHTSTEMHTHTVTR